MPHLKIDSEKCIGCGKCVRICPKQNIQVIDRKAHETGLGCVECAHCVSVCPKGAIELLIKDGDGAFSDIKKSRMFDGRPVSDEDLESLYHAMDRNRVSCEFFTLQGAKLNRFMETVWDIVKDKESETPIVKEWAAWREDHDKLQPNPVLWDGQQVLFIFADGPDSAFIASNRMLAKGLNMGIRGFHSNLIMLSYSIDKERIREYFPDATKELHMAFVIGHGRRLVEPVFKPVKSALDFVKRLRARPLY
jgi:Fe-S-cluster-containing hydrogenase component 2